MYDLNGDFAIGCSLIDTGGANYNLFCNGISDQPDRFYEVSKYKNFEQVLPQFPKQQLKKGKQRSSQEEPGGACMWPCGTLHFDILGGRKTFVLLTAPG